MTVPLHSPRMYVSRGLGDSTFDTFWSFGEFQAASGDAEHGHGGRGGSDLGGSGAFGDLGGSLRWEGWVAERRHRVG